MKGCHVVGSDGCVSGCCVADRDAMAELLWSYFRHFQSLYLH